MALTITRQGTEISTEKLLFTATTDNAPTVTSVVMEIFINSVSIAHTLEHLPDFGSTDDFSFEINSIVKDYFASEFLPLSGANQTAIENALVDMKFYEVHSGVIQPTAYSDEVVIKNITQDIFEIEDFNLADYDCGDTGSATSKLLTSCPSVLPIGDLTSVHVSCLKASYSGTAPTFTPKQEWTIDTYLNGVAVGQTTEALDVPNRVIPNVPFGDKHDISTYRIDFDQSQGYDEVRIYVRDIAAPQTRRSEIKTFKLNDSCEKDLTLSWLNEFGCQDTFTLLGNITRTGKYTDETYKRVRPVAPLSTDVGDLVYKSSYNYEYELYSDRMPEEQVQWLSKILINKRAAIQSKPIFKQTVPSLDGRLYNWYAIDQGNGGDGTASGGIVNPTQTGWRVPSGTTGTDDVGTMNTFLGDVIGNAGGKLKSTDSQYWDAPNTGAINSTGFNALGSGERSGNIGAAFTNIKKTFTFMTHENNGGWFDRYILGNTNGGIGTGLQKFDFGNPIRLVRAATGGENDGDFIANAYTGNDGKKYDAVVIGSQVWINKNLDESLFNDSTPIPEEKTAAWASLTTGAFCFYDNVQPITTVNFSKYFPIVIETDETILEDKFKPETIFKIKFRMANRRKGLK